MVIIHSYVSLPEGIDDFACSSVMFQLAYAQKKICWVQQHRK